MYLKEYELDLAHFLSAPRLAWKACLKKTEIELELLTDNDMSLMIEKGIRGGITNAIYKYAKTNIKYMKNYDKNKESSYLIIHNQIICMERSQNIPVDDFKWIDTSLIDEKFNKFIGLIKNYDNYSNKGHNLS